VQEDREEDYFFKEFPEATSLPAGRPICYANLVRILRNATHFWHDHKSSISDIPGLCADDVALFLLISHLTVVIDRNFYKQVHIPSI